MRRSATRTIAPGVWAGVGGHLEPYEINNPLSACLREVREETGIIEKDISELTLKYILLRRMGDEIRLQYIYFGNTETREVRDTEEGELYWVRENDLFNREFSVTTKALLVHYLECGKASDEVFAGTVSTENNMPVVHWHELNAWNGI